MEKQVILEIRDLDISFRNGKKRNHAVRGVDLDLRRGECVAIVGESGSGKSVSMQAVTGLLGENAAISSGSIRYTFTDESEKIQTVDLLQKDRKWLRKNINGQKIAMIFQDPMTSLDPLMTIGDQLIEGLLLHRKAEKEAALSKAAALLEEVGIQEAERCLKLFPHQLSGGMRQRVVIATALACDPEILICDEPTTALDVMTQSKTLDLIMDLQLKRNLSVIMITHNLGVVARIADYIYVMYAGKVVERGTELDIFYNPKHPYTWGLLTAIPNADFTDERLSYIPGAAPDSSGNIVGDAFAPRNKYAMEADFKEEPPMFRISDTHYAATWLLDERAPRIGLPEEVRKQIERMKEENRNEALTETQKSGKGEAAE